MTTARDVIKASLREIAVIGSGESLDADMANDGLEKLCRMVASWELDGISMGAPTWALTTTLPFPENHMQAIICNLAVRLAPEYGATAVLSAETKGQAAEGYRSLQAVYGDPIDMSIDSALVRRNQWGWTWQ